MKYFITGARGRIGSTLCFHIIQQGADIYRFSRNADALHLPLSRFSDHLEGGDNVLFHLAWSSFPATAEISPGMEWREDLPLLSQILSQLLKIQRSGGRAPLFVFFSSCSVYGEGVAGDRVFFESNPKIPKGWYARGKAEAENLIEGFQSLGLPALILRITNPYGFVQGRSAMQGVIPAIFHAIRDSRPLQVWGDGSATKDFIHMEDLLNAIDFLVANRATGIFNIASSQPTSVNELVSLIESQTGCPVEKCYRPPSAWDVQNGRYSNARLSTLTGWAPKISLEAGIQKYAERFFADSKV